MSELGSLDVRALAALLRPQEEEEEDQEVHKPTTGITPADVGPAGSSSNTASTAECSRPASSSNILDVWEAEENKLAKCEMANDFRPQPQYDITFRERVTASRVYLPMSMASAGEEDVVVRAVLPGDLLTEVTLEVTSTTLSLASPSYYLHLPLPRPVDQRKGVATWDPTTHTLVVTLPTTHSHLFQPTTK